MPQFIPCGTFRVSESIVYHYAGYGDGEYEMNLDIANWVANQMMCSGAVGTESIGLAALGLEHALIS